MTKATSMEPEQAPLSIFPSEGNPGIVGGLPQPAMAPRAEDCLAGFATERADTFANGDRRTPSDESLTRLRMAVAGFQSEMNKLKSQRASAQKMHAAPRDDRGFWGRSRRFGLFAGGVVLAAAAAQLATFVVIGPDAARTLTLSNVENVEAATMSAPVAAVASPTLEVERPAAPAALPPPALASIAPQRTSSRPVEQRAATNGGNQSRVQREFKGSLVIDSVPQGATVLINQSRVGVTPLRLDDYPAGSYALWVQRDGYERWTMAVLVPANRVTQVTSKLTRQK